MKKLIHLGLAAIICISLLSCSSKPQPQKEQPATGKDRIEVLDFHTTHRCHTCLEIERITKKTLAEDYSEEMEAGIITFQLINADDKENETLVEKFSAFGTTLVLNIIQNGQEEHIDLTSFAFMTADDDEKLASGLKEKLDAGLQTLQP